MLSVSQLNLVNSPEHLFFFKHIADNELLIGINNQNHSRGLGSIGEDEGNVGWRWWSKHNGVYVLTFLAPYFEVSTVPDFLLMKNLVSGHGFAGRTIRGVVEDFLFFPPIVVFHGAPSFDALNPLGLNPPRLGLRARLDVGGGERGTMTDEENGIAEAMFFRLSPRQRRETASWMSRRSLLTSTSNSCA